MSAQRRKVLRVIGWIVVATIASGCSHHARRVNCDGRLVPINLPAPKVKEESKAIKGGQKEMPSPRSDAAPSPRTLEEEVRPR